MKPAVSTRNKEEYVMMIVYTHLGVAQTQEPDFDLDPELEGFSVVSSSAQKYRAWTCPEKGAAVLWSQLCAVCGSQGWGG